MISWAEQLFAQFLGALDMVLVLGVIIVVWAVRAILLKLKVSLADTIWRLIVLGLGALCAVLVAKYDKPPVLQILSMLRDAIAYAGATTITYQLWKALWKRLRGDAKVSTNTPVG